MLYKIDYYNETENLEKYVHTKSVKDALDKCKSIGIDSSSIYGIFDVCTEDNLIVLTKEKKAPVMYEVSVSDPKEEIHKIIFASSLDDVSDYLVSSGDKVIDIKVNLISPKALIY